MPGAPQIVFVKFAKFSFSNDRIERFLRETFPEFELHVIDAADYLKRNLAVTAVGLLETSLRMKFALFDGRRSVRAHLMHGLVRSPYIRRKVRAQLERRIAEQCPRARFILVAQTLFGCTVEAVPTFVYTDSAALANLYCEGFRLRDLPRVRWLMLEREFLQGAARVFTWSHHVGLALTALYHLPPANVVRILAGCNLESLPAAAAPAPAGNKTILFVGVDWERKGGAWLVEAFRNLPDRHRDARLIVVGCTPRISIANCTIAGRVPLAGMAAYYRLASIFCMPTKTEPFGIAFIEAMSHSLATVAPRTGAMPDYIEHGVSGLLHRPGDVAEITGHLAWLLDNPDARRAMAARGFEAAQEYRWDKVGRRMRGAIEAYFAETGRALVSESGKEDVLF